MPSRRLLGVGAFFLVAAAGCRSGEGGAPGASASAPPIPAPSAPAASAAASAPTPPRAAPAHSGAAKPHGTTEAVVVLSDPSSAGAEPSATPASVGLPAVDFGAPGPLVITGYPQPLSTGMRDYATYMGYSKDGKSVIACGSMAPLSAKGDEKGNVCFVNDGTTTKSVGLETGGPDPYVGPALAGALKTLKEGYPHDLVPSPPAGTLTPPPVTGTFRFARDIVLHVSGSGGALRVGGQVGKEEAVYPVSLSAKSSLPDMPFSGDWNAILASPSGTELAFLGHFFCMEWCNEMVITRLSHDRIASFIYNDTGFRHHKAKDYAGARDLFLKATWANPKAPLPPYNLACAYALLGDAPNAEKALRLALAVAGEKIKARAKSDPDFKAVQNAKWFKDLTS